MEEGQERARPAEAEPQDQDEQSEVDVIGHVRQDDIEPYTGLRWVGTVFKAAAIFLLVALVGEFIAGLRAGGVANLPYLLGETARTFVFMVVLWGAGDLVRLLVAVGHDIRAQRIFLTRLEWRSREEGERRERLRERRQHRLAAGQEEGGAPLAPGAEGVSGRAAGPTAPRPRGEGQRPG